MIRLLALLCVVAASLGAAIAPAAPIPGMFNTGVDALGAPLGPGQVDPHYVLIQSADPAHPGPSAVIADLSANGYWIPNNASSGWIAPATDESYPAMGTAHPGGDYTYRLSFDLTGLDASTALVSGSFGADNIATIRLNGAATASGSAGYSPLHPFSLSTGFVAGVNHLDFVVTNYGASGSNPTGVRVDGLSGSADASTAVGSERAPRVLELQAPYPNPASRQASIAFVLPRATNVQLVVRDIAGRTVRMLAAGEYAEGRHQAIWDGAGDDGAPARPGVYLVQLVTTQGSATRRLAWTK